MKKLSVILKSVPILAIVFSLSGNVHAATLIKLTGGNAGQGFAPLETNAGSINIQGDETTVQGITFAADPGPDAVEPAGLEHAEFTASNITATSLGFGASPTEDDANMISLLQGFRYVHGDTFDFSNPTNYIQYKFNGLTVGQNYQVDLFTVADHNPRNTNFQVVGSSTFQDTVLSGTTAQIVEYNVTPDASGNIAVRYGFGGSGGGSGDAGLLSAIAITTKAVAEEAAQQGPVTVSIDKASQSVLVAGNTRTIKLQPWSAGTIRVEAAPGQTIPEKKSLSVIAPPNPGGWEVTENDSTVQLKGPRLSAVVDKHNGLVSFSDANGNLLLEQSAWAFKPARNPTRDGLEISASFKRASDEHLYGSGVIRGQLSSPTSEIDLADNNTEIRIPILYSTRGYGFFWDNTSRGKLRLTPNTVTWDSSAGDLADFYIFAGPSADATIAEYRHLTGAAPLFPKWAYGYWFSRDAFTSQQEILGVAQKFRDRQLPIDLLVQDYYYWKPNNAPEGGTGWGSHKFTSDRYPDPKGMIDQLHDKYHIHFMCVIWPKFNPDTDNYKELEEANALFPPSDDWASPKLRYYDPFDPKGREIYGRQVMDDLLSIGLDAFWMDGAEPEMSNDTFAKFDSPIGPVSRLMNAFPLMHTTSVYTAERAATSDKRVLLLPRSSWAGEQRNAAADWTGDILQDWDALAWQIHGMPNYTITGLPYITTDIGGYNESSSQDAELFVRWSECGTFFPLDRVHGGPRPFPWEYGTDDEAILKKFDQLRHRLLPYIYTQASRVTLENWTFMRSLAMDFRDDPKALDTWDEYLFGPSILVCPVYKPEHEFAAAIDQWADRDGKTGGVTVTYGDGSSKHVDLEGDRARAVGHDRNGRDNDAPRDYPDSFQLTDGGPGNSARIEGTITPKETGDYALQVTGNGDSTVTATVSVEGNPVPASSPGSDWHFPYFPFSGQAGTPVHFTIETPKMQPGLHIGRVLPGIQHRDVYLPGKGNWYDFWTGQRLAGGQTLSAEAPRDRIPLYVRAGSILPMGPELQYVDEKPADPIELRVYRGANGSFSLYEDEGDNYDYEKGAFAEIPMTWNETSQTLIIGNRKGSFPGMLDSRTFQIVWVSQGHGGGEEPTEKADSEISYTGTAIAVKAPAGETKN